MGNPFFCNICCYLTTNRCMFRRHLNTKKHCLRVLNEPHDINKKRKASCTKTKNQISYKTETNPIKISISRTKTSVYF